MGKLSICKFGRSVTILSDFSAENDEQLGSLLLSELHFKQDRIDLVNLLNVAGGNFAKAREESHLPAEQMLIILSDGRGVLSDVLESMNRPLS